RMQQIQRQSGLDEEAKEIQRYREWAQNSPDLLNAKDSGGSTPLHNAAGQGRIEVARFLLEHGADVNSRTSARETPLHTAARAGRKAMVDLLLNHRADVIAKNEWGATPLHLAASRGFV